MKSIFSLTALRTSPTESAQSRGRACEVKMLFIMRQRGDAGELPGSISLVKRRRVGEPGAASVFEARSQGDKETKPTPN
jgi:hypothetical protein